jgi:hypothetical protein
MTRSKRRLDRAIRALLHAAVHVMRILVRRQRRASMCADRSADKRDRAGIEVSRGHP